MGIIEKKVKAGDNSGYEPNMEIGLGFELWASIRFNFFSQPKPEDLNVSDNIPNNVFPYGLYVSDFCNKQLYDSSMDIFGEVYLGCIH